ncbi:MAG: biosynthetic-type acetolactate synthase large subunit [Candidatus Dadabacteria bacterium]|nr:biosynthetic-type acetolactate synthase large subunit [Candidatus Dadabacteria bacterium]MYA48190.1 biosynthetic-type acetolactate synthase large subunit [Candidatus Dadabacteria bacterium]MYF48408.1 biosynthetic-type acetolactate synthase large subunit [Candidatus Dadabacteria bacterium]MYG82892.1 biosynthetic-type acetolactate synthase large subunit [Candidatus Dadabacteria bacterium]MYK49545.1 biosynthetic-type acetolactate synthase large subunit [Candidatus Dadabacteria bacterium]
MAKMLGAQMFFETLLHQGIDVVFGLPGGYVLKVYDVMTDYTDRINHVLVRHEQGATHMADGYARASGKPGVVLCTSGPAATNTVTGIATAQMDSSPIVIFTGQVPTQYLGSDAFQEADHIGITRPCTKHNYLVRETRDLPRAMKEAFHIAGTGRPSPVLVDMPKDVLIGEDELVIPENSEIDIKGYKPTMKGNPSQIKRAVEMLVAAKRPVVYSGGGVIWSGATDELLEFCHRLQIPVASTLMGLGGYPASDPLFISMLGMHGSYAANMTVTESDLVISIGGRFDDRATGGNFEEFAPNAEIIHIDIDPSSIDKNITVQCPIVGDAKIVLRQILDALPGEIDLEGRESWLKRIRDWEEKHPLTYSQGSEKILTTYAIDTLYKLTKGDSIIVSDVGQHQMWVAQFYKFERPRTHLTSGGLGTMGFSFPAAMGAKYARPDEQVICVAGDGSFQMNFQELATAVENNLDLKIIVFNNRHHGMVRQWQTMFFESNYSASRFEVLPDFVKLAEAFGARGLRAVKPEELEPTLREGLNTPGVVLMEIEVDCTEMVYPMIAPGGTMDDMIMMPADLA